MPPESEPPQHEARVHLLAKRLLMGGRDAPSSAWLLRRDLLRRTWAWQAAQRLLGEQRPPTAR